MIKFYIYKSLTIFAAGILFFTLSCNNEQSEKYYQGITVAPSYSYYLSGRTDRIIGYIIKIENVKKLSNPGLVILARGIDYAEEAYVEINDAKYNLPSIEIGLVEKISMDSEAQGKPQFYIVTSGDDISGKIVIPLKIEELKNGINEVAFFMNEGSNGFEILDARIETVNTTKPTLLGQTYHLLSRGRPASIKDFDYVFTYRGEKKWLEADIPDWARRGKVNFYRAGIDYDNLDRMFEMFSEACINLVAVGLPREKNSKAYNRVKAFIDRCHENGIKVTAFNSLGGIRLRDLLMKPELENWISHDEYGSKRWRQRGKVFAADLANENYRNYELNYAELQIDSDIDELYYDYAIGGTGDVLEFLADVREIAKKKGRQVTIYGNCKGNILVDEVCDLTKSEGTIEAGVWGGKWVHNIPQARFYYAAGDGVKPYRSKYEGADPGVPNPGAYDVRDDMKYGWKKPIAEASAFQSHFAIAEAGSKLRGGWVKKNNALAMQTWADICRYYTFLDEHREIYTNISTISNIGILAPPRIPSFEVSLTRESLYNALAEMNIMYEILLLHRLNEEMLSNYKAVIIANIPWINTDQLTVIKAYKNRGGKIYTIGSTKDLQDLADIFSPAEILSKLEQISTRRELIAKIYSLEGVPLISIANANYIAANVVKKTGSDKFFLHFVNYHKTVQNIHVKANLKRFVDTINEESIKLFSPDPISKEIKNVSVNDNILEFTLPLLEVYSVVMIN